MKILTTAPMRTTLFGGGTDIESFYKKHGGLCINMAINLMQYVEIEKSDTFKLSAPEGANPDFYKQFTGDKVSIKATCDVPIKSGLGSSASLAVALTYSTYPFLSRGEIASVAWDTEVNKIGLFGGIQDQIAASYGGMNIIELNKNIDVTTIIRDVADEIAHNMAIFYTGQVRKDPKLQENLKELSKDQEKALLKTKELTHQARGYIERGDIDVMAELLKTAWDLKKQTNTVSSDVIDKIYNKAMLSGALAGKGLGSGGGGFMMFIVKPSERDRLIKGLKGMATYYDFGGINYNGVTRREV